MGLLSPGYMPRGVVALLNNLDETAYVGSTETMVYQLPFVAAPKRIYKVHLQAYSVDTDGVGDNASTNIRYAKTSMIMRFRWAAGSTVTTSGTVLGAHRVSVFDDDSTTSSSADCAFYLVNPPAGQLAVGVSIWSARTPDTTYGKVRFLTSTGSHLAVEDVGPFSE
ncbi:hypothetical protein ACGFYA_20495 [Streptomyces sp. NPDC048305]|uniref:DUF7298 domain-containing protein n=1 Tax=Streptomyces sp. NPDC048305 TaxID=3365532 RepID=UPI0037101A7F